MSRRAHLAIALGAALACALGCERTPVPFPETERAELVVFAASSLREVLTALAADLERAEPGLDVTLHFAGSQELRAQLEHGAAADLFAAADPIEMQELERAGRVTAPVVFAHNRLVVVVAREASSSIRRLNELPRAARIVVGAPAVPIGRYTAQLLERADAAFGAGFRDQVLARVVSRELNVKQVLTKVRMGEADAGIVYQSDVQGVADVAVLEILDELNVVADYSVATVVGASHPSQARAFQELLLSASGQLALQGAGFLPRQGGR